MTSVVERTVTRDATLARLKRLDAKTLWVVYHDVAGVGRAKAVPVGRFAEVADHGVTFAMANWDLAITDHQVPHPIFGADSGDFRAVPDPASIVPVPDRPGVAQAFAWLTDDLESPWPGDPRRRLAHQVDQLAGMGIVARVAFEAEFVLADDGDPAALLRDRSRMFSVDALDVRWAFAAHLLAALEAMEVPVHQLAKEYGPGQFEVSLLPADPLTAADRLLLLRQVAKSTARAAGLGASFMPKPYADLPGNGLHVHIGLDGLAGGDRELVGDAKDDRSITPTGAAAIAGLIAHASGQAALGAPTPNSYKRLLPGSWAPAHACWGFGNRAALVRIPGRGAARHLEYRAGDASMNPYLHLAGLLASIVDGIRRERPAIAETAVDIGHLSDQEAAATGAPRLPARLDAALDALEADPVLLDALGPVVAPHYLAVKRFEWESYLAEGRLGPDAVEVSDWERSVYFEPV